MVIHMSYEINTRAQLFRTKNNIFKHKCKNTIIFAPKRGGAFALQCKSSFHFITKVLTHLNLYSLENLNH